MCQTPAARWFVYIVQCVDGSLYTGITTDLRRRCRQHNDGKASRYTRCRRPVRLVYREVLGSRSQALKREAAVKSLSRQQKERLIRQAGRVRRVAYPPLLTTKTKPTGTKHMLVSAGPRSGPYKE